MGWRSRSSGTGTGRQGRAPRDRHAHWHTGMLGCWACKARHGPIDVVELQERRRPERPLTGSMSPASPEGSTIRASREHDQPGWAQSGGGGQMDDGMRRRIDWRGGRGQRSHWLTLLTFLTHRQGGREGGEKKAFCFVIRYGKDHGDALLPMVTFQSRRWQVRWLRWLQWLGLGQSVEHLHWAGAEMAVAGKDLDRPRYQSTPWLAHRTYRACSLGLWYLSSLPASPHPPSMGHPPIHPSTPPPTQVGLGC